MVSRRRLRTCEHSNLCLFWGGGGCHPASGLGAGVGGSRRTGVTSRRVPSALIVVLFAVPLAGVATMLTTQPAGAAVSQYADPSISNPTSIATGSDGALWFTNSGSNSIGRVTTNGMVTNYADP